MPSGDLHFFPAFDAKLLYSLSWYRAFRMQLSLCNPGEQFNSKWGRKGYCWTKTGGEVLSFKNVLKSLMFLNNSSNICLKNLPGRADCEADHCMGVSISKLCNVSIPAALQLSKLQLVMKEENFSSFLTCLLSHPMMIKPAVGV